MTTLIRPLATPHHLLFDGLSDDFYEYVFRGDGFYKEAIAMDDIYDNYFRRLLPIIGESAFQQILAQGDFLRYSDEYAFKGSDKLSLKFFLSESSKIIVVFALGEFQPGRYKIYIEGVWGVEKQDRVTL